MILAMGSWGHLGDMTLMTLMTQHLKIIVLFQSITHQLSGWQGDPQLSPSVDISLTLYGADSSRLPDYFVMELHPAPECLAAAVTLQCLCLILERWPKLESDSHQPERRAVTRLRAAQYGVPAFIDRALVCRF